MRPHFYSLRPGRLSYRAGLALQEGYLTTVLTRGDLLILLAHPATITLGRSSAPEHLLSSPALLQEQGVEVFRVARGGDVTYHGPDQVVGYPLIDLSRRGRDLHRYLRDLEEVLILTLAQWGISGRRHPNHTGVWVAEGKIASLGVGVRRWVSWHGFALNLGADPAGFAHIIPCGLTGVQMTSMEELLGYVPERRSVEDALIANFAEVFDVEHAGSYD